MDILITIILLILNWLLVVIAARHLSKQIKKDYSQEILNEIITVDITKDMDN